MIRINWSEVEATKIKLLRGGATDSLEMIVIIFYHSKSDCDKLQIRLGQLEQVFFDLGSNEDIRSIHLYDIAIKKPYFRCEESERGSGIETVPVSGHPNVVMEFSKMSQQAKDVWLEITMSQQYHHVSEGV
tara:strand:- start:623 stop:1015 length:393 start_codon:yes stop_codon:yes gene_type:complete